MLGKNNDVTEASRFLASTLHEIRTPIQTIIGTIELISETHLDKEQTEYIRQIQFSAEVLLNLANNILDFTKIRSNEFKLESIPFDIAQVTEQVIDLISIEAFNKDVEIVVDIDPKVPPLVTGDSVRVQQIMLNLVKNAVKFTNSGYIHVELLYTDDKKVEFRVTDSGIGIPEDKQKKLFTDYFQADISTYMKFGGTGLGLSICKNLVKVMRGEIGVKSNPYGGTIFHFTIPLPDSLESNMFAIERAPDEKVKKTVDSGMKVLIVDEHVLSVQSIKRKMGEFGITKIDEAQTADDAILMIEFAEKIGAPYNAVFINLVLSKMDGWHLASEIKSDEKITKNFKMYLMVPEGQMRGEAKMKLLDWFDGYIYKPVKRDNLFDTLKMAAEKSSAEDGKPREIDITPPIETVPKSLDLPEVDDSKLASGLKILVAEDHPVNRKLIETVLKRFGADVYLAEDGEDAVERIRENPDITLVFMDIFMPIKSGVEATEELRKGGYTGIIVACTANNDSNDFADYMKIGVNDILVKPFKRQAVKSIIEKWNSVLQIPISKDILIETLTPVKSSEDDEIWDYKEFLDTVANDREFAKMIIEDFIIQSKKLIDEIDENMRTTIEPEKIHKLAHTIKGSAGAVFASKISSAARALDEAAKKADTLDKAARLSGDEVRERFEEFQAYSKSIMERL
ncbi:MAG: response regulator [Treponema sp.]|nr:response regulator [Treponema sp.]